MAPKNPFDGIKRKKKFKKDAQEKQKKTTLLTKSRDREKVYRTLNDVVEVERMDRLSGKKTPVSRNAFVVSDAIGTDELADLVVGTDGSESEYEILKIEDKTTMIYIERYFDPDSGDAMWDYEGRGNSQKLMMQLIGDGLCGLINCFQDDFDKVVKRKDGREGKVKVYTYQGVPVKRVTG